MRELIRSYVTNSIAIAAASTLAFVLAPLPADPHSPRTQQSDVSLAAASTVAPATPPPGALIEQFLANQVQNCSLICPFIIQALVQVPVKYAILPLTLVRELQAGVPFVQGALLSDATVSGALNDAVTGIISNDLDLVLPRAQNALEVAVVGLIDVGLSAVTQPGNLPAELNNARTSFFTALTQPPGTMPPPAVHNSLEAFAVRAIEVTSALTFQAPERLLLGGTQAVNAFFTTIGTTGNLAATIQAVEASVSKTGSDSAGFIRHALDEPIVTQPVTTGAGTPVPTSSTTLAAFSRTTATSRNTSGNAGGSGGRPNPTSSVVGPSMRRLNAPSVGNAPAAQVSSVSTNADPPRSRAVSAPGDNKHLAAKKPPGRGK
jgi:hypothetical protein